MKQLTVEQHDALAEFARYNGRTWKAELRQAWMTGHYPAITKDTASLQQVRNSFGPTWLTRFKLSAKTTPEKQLISDLWDFIENVTDEDPERNSKFFALRARVRDIFCEVI
jgi:hypothetical protein